jgi:pimeloyl-ACP methyl ester carboxylesterase
MHTSRTTILSAIALIAPLAWAGLAQAQYAPAQRTAPMQNQQMRQSNARAGMHGNGQGQHATVNGMKIFYRVSGQGEPLLLIHGYPLNDNLFKHQRQKLSDHFKVIMPDLPGFGQSKAKNSKASLKMYAKTMFGLMDKLNIKKAIIGGHSMGGMTVIEMYKMHPDRFKGMILFDTAAMAAPLPRKGEWNGFAKLAQQKSDYNKKMAMLIPPDMLSYQDRMHHKQYVHQAKSMIKAASKNGVIGGGHALANRPNNKAVLKKVDVPTLIVVGAQDPITPVEIAKKMHKEIDGSKLDIVKHASHLALFEKSEKVDHAIEHWASKHSLQGNGHRQHGSRY